MPFDKEYFRQKRREFYWRNREEEILRVRAWREKTNYHRKRRVAVVPPLEERPKTKEGEFTVTFD